MHTIIRQFASYFNKNSLKNEYFLFIFKAIFHYISMKNKDPKIKDADKQVKLKKQKSSSSLPWIIVGIFLVLGAITIGGFYWYKKSQENYE